MGVSDLIQSFYIIDSVCLACFWKRVKCYYILNNKYRMETNKQASIWHVIWDHVMTCGEVSRLANSVSYIQHNPNQLLVSYGVR